MDGFDNYTIRFNACALVVAAIATLALGGCASTMSSGMPDDAYKVGAQRDEEEQPAAQAWTAEQKYEYRGGRDPITGRAKTQM